MTSRGERTGVLVLRAWLEQHGAPLRVRITERLELLSAEERSRTVVGADAAAEAVRDWLLHLEGLAATGTPPPANPSETPEPEEPDDDRRSPP